MTTKRKKNVGAQLNQFADLRSSRTFSEKKINICFFSWLLNEYFRYRFHDQLKSIIFIRFALLPSVCAMTN